MRFLSISSNRFGFLRSNSLTSAPQFTIVYGPNETGKSTWHAALYAAFCGMRRSRIQSWADEEFIQKYRPWNSPQPWEVSVRFLLQDGRNIELHQELADRIDCRATDVDSAAIIPTRSSTKAASMDRCGWAWTGAASWPPPGSSKADCSTLSAVPRSCRLISNAPSPPARPIPQEQKRFN